MAAMAEEMTQRLEEFLERVRSVPPIKLEGQTLEVKGWCGNPKELSEEIAEAAVCLANADGGLVVIGVLDKRTAPECYKPCPYETVNPGWVEDRIAVLTKPPVICRAHRVSELLPKIKGTPEECLIVLNVLKTSSLELHKFQGVCYKRRHDQCPIEYSTSADDYSDRTLPDIGPDAIDSTSLAEALNALPGRYRYAITEWDFLRNCGLVRKQSGFDAEREFLTVAALLLLGKASVIRAKIPHAQIAISYQGKDGLSTIVKTETLNIVQAVHACRRELEGRTPIDGETMQEVIVNALVHRDYRARSITQISISEEELSFVNPGSLLAGLNPENLIRAQPIYRNFRLADGARQAGLCRKYGDGIDRIYYTCLSQGLDFPFITADEEAFRITFSARANSAFAQFIKARSQSLANLDHIIVIKSLDMLESCTLEELSSRLQRPEAEAEKVLSEMTKANMVARKELAFVLTPTVKEDIRSFEPSTKQLSLWSPPEQ